ncbi:MAG: helix-turn-helix domain-containing protein [Alphaproteobacteria bacterium]|nr:helix-turn-helix domain-containing protein [Alphaproteobacteria bacterium]
MMELETKKLLTTQEAAVYLGLQTKTLNNWRYNQRTKLKYVKLGGAIRYSQKDLDDFIIENTKETPDEYIC